MNVTVAHIHIDSSKLCVNADDNIDIMNMISG